MKFSYYFYLTVALLAVAQYSYHRFMRQQRVPVPAPYANSGPSAHVPDKVDIKYRQVKEGFERRAKYLTTKEPD